MAAEEQARREGIEGIPVSPALGSLLPGGVLRRGVAVNTGGDLPLMLALAAQAAGDGGWAAVGLPGLGALAASGAGLDLGAGMWVDRPGKRWPEVVATVVEAVPVVLLGALGPVPERAGRRIGALLRRSGSVLLAAGEWPGAEVRLRVREAVWEGVGDDGHGLLRGRRVRVEAYGRGAAGVPRSARLWLPGSDGGVSVVSAASVAEDDPAPGERGPGERTPRPGAEARRGPLRVVG